MYELFIDRNITEGIKSNTFLATKILEYVLKIEK